MKSSDLDRAERAAHQAVRNRADGTTLALVLGYLLRRVTWILRGGERPPGCTSLVQQVTAEAVDIGLELVFGFGRQDKFPQDICARRDSL